MCVQPRANIPRQYTSSPPTAHITHSRSRRHVQVEDRTERDGLARGGQRGAGSCGVPWNPAFFALPGQHSTLARLVLVPPGLMRLCWLMLVGFQ
jgi:hypothetical protein